MIRVLTAALLGALIAAAIVGLITKSSGYLDAVIVLAVAFVVSLLIGVFGTVAAAATPGAWRIPQIVERAAAEGRLAVALPLDITETGTRINAQPLCELRLLVLPSTGSAYRTTIRSVLSILDISRLSSGAPIVVGIRRPGRPDVAVVPDPPAEWAERAARAAFPDPGAVPIREQPLEGVGLFRAARLRWSIIGFLAAGCLALVPLLFG